MSKLKFQVVYCSGEDKEFPATELNSLTKTTAGYKTAKYCEYPQELVVQLECSLATIKQVQILSHHSNIASKIELYLTEDLKFDHSTSFKKLGFINLNSNEEADFQARELKSIYIDKAASFIKFKLQKCYINKHNPYNQVGIMAINILGEPISSIENSSLPHDSSFVTTKEIHEKNGFSSIQQSSGSIKDAREDISSDIQFDPLTAQRIREVHLAKEKAAEMEDYDEAKRYKALEEELKYVGIQLARLEQQKLEAVQAENYDRAKSLKAEIDSLRQSIEERLPFQSNTSIKLNLSISRDLPISVNSNQVATAPLAPNRMKNSFLGNVLYPSSVPPPVNSISPASPFVNTSSSFPGDVSYQVPPSLKPSSPSLSSDIPLASSNSLSNSNTNQDDKTIPEPEKLSPELAQEIAGLINIYGDFTMRCFYSSNWTHRDSSIQEIRGKIRSLSSSSVVILKETCKVLAGGLSDKVSQVFLSSLSLLEDLVSYAHALKKADTLQAFDLAISTLVNKLGDGQQKIKDASTDALIMLTKLETIGVSAVISRIVKKTSRPLTAWKPIEGRLNILQLLLENSQINQEDAESIMEYLSDGSLFTHSNASVRDKTRDLCILLHKDYGIPIDKYLEKLRPKQLEEYQSILSDMSKRKSKESTGKQHEEIRRSNATDVKEFENLKLQDREEDDEGEDEEENNEFTCQFCGMYNPSFTDETLDIHYWSECLMLTPCSRCEQVIEISCLNEHIVKECEAKFAPNDMPLGNYSSNCCPLCQEKILNGEKGWKKHLLQNKCPKNSRNTSK